MRVADDLPGSRRFGIGRRVGGLIVLLTSLLGVGCSEEPPPADGAGPHEVDVPTGSTLRLVPDPDRAPELSDARLGFASPDDGARFAPGEPVEVRLRGSGFELASPTAGGRERGIARDSRGQYVSLILNDEPPRAVHDLSRPVVLDDLPEGTHVLRAFPTLDWHESVKSPGAFVMRVIHVGQAEAAPSSELEGPLLTYARPVGSYRGAAADSILVDFHLSGVRLSPEGYRVRLTVEGMDALLITRWEPHLLVGLPRGEHTVRMELLDPRGAVVPGRFNRSERTIVVEPL